MTVNSLTNQNALWQEKDRDLFFGGEHETLYEVLGAHPMEKDGVAGTYFAVWAPHAVHVSVAGSFNDWNPHENPMTFRSDSGIWEAFVPRDLTGAQYKFAITAHDGETFYKSDPFAFFAELRPGTASVVHDLSGYSWKDGEWMQKRARRSPQTEPMNIYEVHLGSWRKGKDENREFITYREAAKELVPYAAKMGYTHIEFMPLMEHPYDGSWGYQVTGYFAATSRYGTPEDLMFLVDTCHQANLGVILDWVPAHFPRDAHGLRLFDGTPLYEYADPRIGEHKSWGTLVFDYGKNEVRSFLLSNADFWLRYYHIDGLRVDAVASMLYLDYDRESHASIKNKYGGNENLEVISFFRMLNAKIYAAHPGITMIAEESTAWPMVTKPAHDGGLGFGMKWNMGWMNDLLGYMSLDPLFRKHNHDRLTFSLMYAFAENYILPFSHDEVVHGKCSLINKMPGEYEMKFSGLRAMMGYQLAHPGKKLNFMGNEFAQFIEWDFQKPLDWMLLEYPMHQKFQKYIREINRLYRECPCLHRFDDSPESFEWIHCDDRDHSVVSLMRKGNKPSDALIFVFNFTPVIYKNYRIGLPSRGVYEEVLNSDAKLYGGSGLKNRDITAEKEPFHGRAYSGEMTLPPLSMLVFRKKPTQRRKKKV